VNPVHSTEVLPSNPPGRSPRASPYDRSIQDPSVWRIEHFDQTLGIEAAPVVILDEFQGHGMRCRPDQVEIAGPGFSYGTAFSGPTAMKT
jgi:hypothetical protein